MEEAKRVKPAVCDTIILAGWVNVSAVFKDSKKYQFLMLIKPYACCFLSRIYKQIIVQKTPKMITIELKFKFIFPQLPIS